MSLLPFVQVRRYKSFLGIRIAPTESRQPSFHIALLLDVSGSMAGERLDTVQKTLRLFADQMQPEDRVSVVTYNGDARVLCHGANRDVLLAHVSHLVAGGGTNLEAGLMALTSLDLPTVDAVFLLTDGEVNQGISSVRGLETMARFVAFGTHKIPVYTLGYGADHNARLLQAIAVETRASYTFAETNEMIPSVVGSILVAMRDEVAKGVTIEWTGDAVCWEAGAIPEATAFCVGSVIAHKPQWVVLRGCVDSLTIGAMGMERWALEVPAEGDEGENEDEDVLEQWFRAESVRVFREVMDSGPMGLPRLQALEDALVASPVADRPLMLRIRAQIAEQRDLLDRPMPPAMGPALTRFVSGMTAYATQRGDPDFYSPSQRTVSSAMAHHFTQSVSNEDPDSLHP